MSGARDPNSFLRILEAPGKVENYFVSHMEGEEGLSIPSLFTLRIRSQGEIPPPVEWIGSPITFSLGGSDSVPRRINGQCVRFEQSYQKGGYVEFVLDVAPMFVRCKQRRDCRIFTDMTAIEVIETILFEHKFSFDSTLVSFVDDRREYCVQYWETDFDFCCRLMEEEGIFYFFRYNPDAGRFKHTMYLADNQSAYFDGDIYQITYREDELHQGLTSIDLQHMQYTSAWMTHDYDYKKPTALNPIKTSTRLGYAAKDTKFYEWPGGYQNTESGQRRSRFGIELAEAASVVMSGAGTYMGFIPGARFEIVDKRLRPAERRIAIHSVRHSAHNPYSSAEGEPSYEQGFTAVPSYEPYHPPRNTPRASVHGPQTAVVLDQVDPEGFGRVKVRFHWDHVKGSTCWLRVAQQWGGDQIGAQWIPRIGMEVLVAFLDGDPDRPVVVGSLYNGDNHHPFKVPEHLSQAGWRTRSHPKGDVINAFIFEDKAEHEEIFTHAGRNYRREVIKDEDVDIGDFLTKRIGKDEKREVGGVRTTKIKKDDLTEIGGRLDTKVAEGAHLQVGQGLAVDVKGRIRIDSSSATEMVTTGAFTLESKTSLTFLVGGSRIDISAAGIMINGALVKIN